MENELDAKKLEQMIIMANKMAELGNNANKYIIKSFEILNEMKNIWYGEAYDKTINEVNNYIDKLNENMEFITKQGPLELINKVMMRSNNGLNTINAINDVTLSKIDKLIKSNKAPKLRFLSSKIEIKKDLIDDNLEKTTDCLDDYKKVLQDIEWNIGDEENIIFELKKMVNHTKNSIKKIKELINNTIEFQKSTIKSIENDLENNKAQQNDLDDKESDIENVYKDLMNQLDDTSAKTWDFWT